MDDDEEFEREQRFLSDRTRRRVQIMSIQQVLDLASTDAISGLRREALGQDLYEARRTIEEAASLPPDFRTEVSVPPNRLLEFGLSVVDIFHDARMINHLQEYIDNRYVYTQPGNRQYGRWLSGMSALVRTMDMLQSDLAVARGIYPSSFADSMTAVDEWLVLNKRNKDRLYFVPQIKAVGL